MHDTYFRVKFLSYTSHRPTSLGNEQFYKNFVYMLLICFLQLTLHIKQR